MFLLHSNLPPFVLSLRPDMERVVLVAALMLCTMSYAWAQSIQETCEAKAVTKDGAPLLGAAKASFLRKCMRDACQQQEADHVTPAPSGEGIPTAVPIKTGIIRKSGKGSQVAPLKIEADAGNYVIKIVEKASNAEVMLIFIEANQPFETKLALGTYKMHGASGHVWYGEKHLFGPCTNYFELRRSTEVAFAGDDEFKFTLVGRTYHGHHIQLRKVVDGNLETQPIMPGEF